ncbi:hypothetical protein CGLO_14683 [Colletotrichum gloeosporioides Cg-14]|uniref:Uncharacterized protein n=1 Tax=Colletotrichum gloeosporioides (strain Cg-14) TaxID=1237896 RepID=T0K0H6_COLGC|nr:hypothetical protein CGLO_14683 [Colletotrichum gloeosporioides Cg-14]
MEADDQLKQALSSP